jgi:hypothetical protein
MVLDLGVEDEETPIILGRPFLNTTTLSSALDLDKSTSNSQMKRYAVTLIVILIMNSPKRTTIGEDVDPAVKQSSL